jgi:hypothetical protein
MTEVIELLNAAVDHKANQSKDCPFCPIPPIEQFTTKSGKDNDSSVLEDVMVKPSVLPGKQGGGVRPKNGKAHRQRTAKTKKKPNPIFQNRKWGKYSAEAHHLISGNQAMKGEDIEDWIVAGKLVKKDTGYSINNSDNGEWLPSIPDKYKGGKWSDLDFDEKLEIASAPMKKNKGQFHKGPHNVVDKEDLLGVHTSYPKEVKRLLADLVELLFAWVDACPICENVDKKKGPFDPNWRIHNMIDALSRGIGRDLKGSPGNWYYFISKVAMKYHNTPGVCRHTTV